MPGVCDAQGQCCWCEGQRTLGCPTAVALLQTGSAEKCLREAYSNLLEAALSMPLAIMASMLHDVAASLTFNAAAAAARRLQQQPHRWRHHIDVSTRVKCVHMGIRVEMWQAAPLTPVTAPAHDAAEAPPDGSAADPPVLLSPAIEVGTLRGSVACCCDPPVGELWSQAGVQVEMGLVPREPRLDPVEVDLESTMLVCLCVRVPGILQAG